MDQKKKCSCGFDLGFAPGIGEYCTNKHCPKEAKLWEEWQKQEAQVNKDIADKVLAWYEGDEPEWCTCYERCTPCAQCCLYDVVLGALNGEKDVLKYLR
ncbi:hypothetical protein IID24_03240 [Patescibacteria group bacterium]|nr:hypothetical protein [Patescibacteria group bacterium]